MNNVVITRQSLLFRIVAFLSQFPIYSSFIKAIAKSYNEDLGEYNEDYNTFNDVCTFCRHFIFIILTSFFYAFLFVIILNCLIIQPLIVLFGGSSLQGSLTITAICILILVYFVLLVIQKVIDFFVNRKKKTETVSKEEGKENVFLKTYDLLSQKHHDFCKRLEVKDK